MINKVHFGKRISALRQKTGLSQTELAERLGITSQAVSKWETGHAIPDIDLLLELSHLYHVSINEMLEDLYEDTVLAGFNKIDSVISGSWYTDSDDSTIADLARSMGVNLKFTSYVRYCTKG